MNDQELVNKVIQGDQHATRQLIEQYQRLVVHTVARLIDDNQDREELCQDVFMKVFKHIGSFKFDSKLSTWIATIAYRLAINFLKKQKRRKEEQDLDKVAFELGT
ncbi:MAG: sigma-70 family RNA polymerase sigma factor, partial [Bacteroidota bacterium]